MTSKWFKAAVIRALKTFAQVLASMITIDTVTGIGQIDWLHIASVAAVSAIYSVVTSIAGLPEVPAE